MLHKRLMILLSFLFFAAVITHSFELNKCPSNFNNPAAKSCINELDTVVYQWNCSCFVNSSSHRFLELKLKNFSLRDTENVYFDPQVAHIIKNNNSFECEEGKYKIEIFGDKLGETVFDIAGFKLPVKVCRKQTQVEYILMFVVMPLVLLNKFAFGAKIELLSLKTYLLQPKELSLCFFVQFCLLPLFAIAWGYVFKLDIITNLSLLIAAVCPGGGGGYVFSYLIKGDITLAIAASLFSTLFAMIAMPVVIGIYIALTYIPNNITIPYLKIIMILIMIAIPISSGMVLRHYSPEWSKKFVKIIKPLSLFLVLCGAAWMTFMTKYIIMYGPWQGYILGFLVPGSGYLIAMVIARIAGFEWSKTKAIFLESGMKNTLLGVAVIEISFPQPKADLNSVIMFQITAGQTILCLIFYLCHLVKSAYLRSSEYNDNLKVKYGKDFPEDRVAFLSRDEIIEQC